MIENTIFVSLSFLKTGPKNQSRLSSVADTIAILYHSFKIGRLHEHEKQAFTFRDNMNMKSKHSSLEIARTPTEIHSQIT